eukprot:11518938-Alexandrium_andersonii.AAC.1
MSASLVGSEMCIRDSVRRAQPLVASIRALPLVASIRAQPLVASIRAQPLAPSIRACHAAVEL